MVIHVLDLQTLSFRLQDYTLRKVMWHNNALEINDYYDLVKFNIFLKHVAHVAVTQAHKHERQYLTSERAGIPKVCMRFDTFVYSISS